MTVSLFELLKAARLQRQLSQTKLASLAGVSLPTIQNIEAGRANPAWSTVVALLKALQLGWQIHDDDLNWPSLRNLGCPLSGETSGAAPTADLLLHRLQGLNGPLMKVKSGSREAKALKSWLAAIEDHYPSIWRQVSHTIKEWSAKEEGSIKLRRIALQSLAVFL